MAIRYSITIKLTSIVAEQYCYPIQEKKIRKKTLNKIIKLKYLV